MREDESEEIIETIQENLKQDAKDDASEEKEISLKKEENLSKGSDEEMYSWDKIEYKTNYVWFISNETVTEQQMQVASAMVNKLEEPVYDHRARIKERSRPLQKCNENQPISVFWEIGGIKSHCLIDSRCEGIMISLSFIRAVKIEPFLLNKPIGIQLAVTDSKSVINYGANVTIKYNEKKSKEYFNIVNIDYYNTILGTPFLKKHKVIIDLMNNCLRIKDKVVCNQENKYKVGEGNPQKNKKNVSMKALKQEEPKVP